MSESKFTPGPWLIEDERDGTFSVWTRQPHTGTLATVHEEDINGAYPAKANAQLMSVAPELLSIAQRWLALDSQWHPERHASEKTQLLAETRDLIAKATA